MKDTLGTTSKRLFLLEHEKDSLTKAVSSGAEANVALRQTVDKLSSENMDLRDRMAKLEMQVASVVEQSLSVTDRLAKSEAQVARLSSSGSARRAFLPDVAATESALTQTELHVSGVLRELAPTTAATQHPQPMVPAYRVPASRRATHQPQPGRPPLGHPESKAST